MTTADMKDGAPAQAARSKSPWPKSPWYVEMFLAFGGWIAGLLAAGAIFAFIAVFIPNFTNEKAAAAAAVVFGSLFAAGGTWLSRRRRGDFFRHFAIAAVAAGFTALVVGIWYLADSLAQSVLPQGTPGLVRTGNAGLATAALFTVIAILVTRLVKDAILTFLTSLALFGILAVSLSVLHSEHVLTARTLEVFPAASVLIGLFLFTRPIGGSVAAAAGAALMVGPVIFYDAWVENGRFIGFDTPPDGRFEAAVYGAALLYCLWRLRDRFAFFPLAASAVLLLAGIWFLPGAGSVAIVILCAGIAAGHRGLAAVGVVALAWFIAKFYNDLSVSLLMKSAILTGLGAATLFGALAVRRFYGASSFDPQHPRPRPRRRARVLTLASGALLAGSLYLVNDSVMKVEASFKNSRVMLLPLGPVDPRSILQGDYMGLYYRETIYPSAEEVEKAPDRGEAFLRLDHDSVASFSRFANPSDQPAADEIRVDYKKTRYGQMSYCPAEWFFQEGEADLFSRARFAVVRVAPDGRTRLIALADENRNRIDPQSQAKTQAGS